MSRVHCAEEQSKQPTAKPFTAWADAWKSMEPTVAETEKGLLAELDELRKQERYDFVCMRRVACPLVCRDRL